MVRFWRVLPLLVLSGCLLSACSSDTSPVANKAMGISDDAFSQGQSQVWGGQHISLEIVDGSAHIEFDCAHADIGLMPDTGDQGRFTTRGSYTFEHSGPIHEDEDPDIHPAFFSGTIFDDQMTLFVRLTDTGDQFGPFELTEGTLGLVRKCL